MASNHPNSSDPRPEEDEEEDTMLDAADVAEEVNLADDGDHPMDSDPDDDATVETEEIILQNDSIAHFSHHTDSLFTIAAHPLNPNLVATGSGDDAAYVFSTANINTASPLLPRSYESNPTPLQPRDSLEPIAHLTGHKDSVACLAFTQPDGAYLVTGGLDGQLRIYTCPSPSQLSSSPSKDSFKLLTSASEVPEISWLAACPSPSHPHTFAIGSTDGSVWVYAIDPSASGDAALLLLQAYYLHTVPTTAGAWSPSGSLLASVAEDSTLHVYDPFGDAAAAGVSSLGQALISLGPEDQRFNVDGGLYSLAFSPGTGGILAAGGAGGVIRIVGMPILSQATPSSSATKSQKGAGAKSKAGGSKQAHAPSSTAGGQAGQILASLQAQSDGVETLAFADPSAGAGLALLAAGSVDGSIALFDTARNFAVRRVLREAHGEEAVVKVAFDSRAADGSGSPWVLTSCGMDGIVRRWDCRGGGQEQGMLGEWKGHRGGGEGGGVMGFVVGGGQVVTAGDDGVALVFNVGGS
ncbi:hypothetical protein MMC10_000549 [Thelotrema lepadinum]|nr:hypothetical protein [Thelotrema lepadinum]